MIATGSEVQLAWLKAQATGRKEDRRARGLHAHHHASTARPSSTKSGRCCPQGCRAAAVEMGVTDGWWKYGCAPWSASTATANRPPAPVLFKHFGFTNRERGGHRAPPCWSKPGWVVFPFPGETP